jgi:hypothetical protein
MTDESKPVNVEGESERSSPSRQAVACSHPHTKLGDRFCRDCGDGISGPSRESVTELVEEVLRSRGLIPGEGQAEKPDPDAALRQEYEQYEAAPRKWWESPRYSDFDEFKAAPSDERKTELAKYGIKAAWVPRHPEKVAMG